MSIAEQIAASEAAQSAAATAPAAPKKAAPPITRRSTQYRIDAAKGRIVKANEAIVEDTALVAELEALLPTLPEQAPAAAKVVANVGDTVDVNVGREATRKLVTGKVVAVKKDAEGAVERYAVEVGEGFDADRIRVYPGSVVAVYPAGTEAAAEDTAAPTDIFATNE